MGGNSHQQQKPHNCNIKHWCLFPKAGWVLIFEGCLFFYWLLIDTWHLHFLWYIWCLVALLLLISVQCFYKCRLLPNCKGCMPDSVCLWRQTLWPHARGLDVIGRLHQHHRHTAHAKLGISLLVSWWHHSIAMVLQETSNGCYGLNEWYCWTPLWHVAIKAASTGLVYLPQYNHQDV